MTKLLLQTVESTVSDEDIMGFLCRYGFPPFVSIERMAGTGIRPGVLLGFQDLQPEALQQRKRLVPAVVDGG